MPEEYDWECPYWGGDHHWDESGHCLCGSPFFEEEHDA